MAEEMGGPALSHLNIVQGIGFHGHTVEVTTKTAGVIPGSP